MMGAAVWMVMLGLEQSESLLTNLMNLGILVAVGAVVYGGGAIIAGMPEFRWALGRR